MLLEWQSWLKEILKKIVSVLFKFVRKVPTSGRVCQSVTGIKCQLKQQNR
jgi:hypothetical protein